MLRARIDCRADNLPCLLACHVTRTGLVEVQADGIGAGPGHNVRSIDTRQSSIDEIRRLIVNPASRRPVTLDAVADVTISQGPSEIRRVAQERVQIITANVAYGDLGAAAAEARRIVRLTPLPSGMAPGRRIARSPICYKIRASTPYALHPRTPCMRARHCKQHRPENTCWWKSPWPPPSTMPLP